MRRRFWIALVMLLPSLVLLVFVLPSKGAGAERQVTQAVVAYLALRYDVGARGQEDAIRHVVAARRPWRFERSMRQASLDSEVLTSEVFRDARSSAQIDAKRGYTLYGYIVPDAMTEASSTGYLPYPPRALWCVWLDKTPAEILFVAEHHALYRVDWIVHVPLADDSLPQVLSEIGCREP